MPFEKIIRAGRNCWVTGRVDETGVIIDGRDYFLAFYRAARQAKRYIAIAGWQFDSAVSLVGKGDEEGLHGEFRFLDFLNSLCSESPDLHVYILAWDHSLIFALEREFMQESVFRQKAHERISFQFDSRHPIAASHHQKFCVIDGRIAFLGGMDICANRWDDRRHLPNNPGRVSPYGEEYGPYHDVHSFHTGPVVEKLAELFEARWRNSTGDDLGLSSVLEGNFFTKDIPGLRIPADFVSISRTQSRSLFTRRKSIKEIRRLYIDAVQAANELIYIESQYFSSYAVYRAIVNRMRSKKGKLQLIIMLPRREQTVFERAYVGITQGRLLRSLMRVARKKGHAIGIYYPAITDEDGGKISVFIHSKLMLVDDRFLTIGSANINNRSMGLDTELNVSWEAIDEKSDLPLAFRRVRTELLSEHTGMAGDDERLAGTEGLVDYLDAMADSRAWRLCKHNLHRRSCLSRLLELLRLEKIFIDPEKAVIDEHISEVAAFSKWALIKRVNAFIGKWLRKKAVKGDKGLH